MYIKICKIICKLRNRKVWTLKNLEEMENGLQKHRILAWYSNHHFLSGRPRISKALTREKQLSLMKNKLQEDFIISCQQRYPWVEAFVDCSYYMCCSVNNKWHCFTSPNLTSWKFVYLIQQPKDWPISPYPVHSTLLLISRKLFKARFSLQILRLSSV